MGICLSVKSKNRRFSKKEKAKPAPSKVSKPIKKNKQLSSQDSEKTSKIDLTKPLKDPMEIFHKFESRESSDEFSDPDAEVQDNKTNPRRLSLIPGLEKKQVNFARIIEKNRRSVKYNNSSQTTNATKSSSIVLSSQLPELMNNHSEGLCLNKKEDEFEIIINSPYDSPLDQLGSDHDFINKLFLNRFKKRQSEDSVKKRGPRRITQYSSFKETSPRPGLNAYPNMQLDFSTVVENVEEHVLSSSAISISQQDISEKDGGVFFKSLVVKELESIDLRTDGKLVHIFSVPYSKNIKESCNHNKKTVKINYFDCFYKDKKMNPLHKEESLNIQFFPNRWEDGIVPYSIEKPLFFVINPKNESLNNLITTALKVVSESTVIKFLPYSSEKHKDYLNFQFGTSNKSLLGCHGGENPISLTNRADIGVILHEIMHSLGFMHEYRKSSKERFYYLNKAQLNTQSDLEENKNICISGLDFGPFDESSILHYRSCENMICFKDPLHPDEVSLSPLDISKINLFYQFGRPESEIKEQLKALKQVGRLKNR